jgi:hypothetical protein
MCCVLTCNVHASLLQAIAISTQVYLDRRRRVVNNYVFAVCLVCRTRASPLTASSATPGSASACLPSKPAVPYKLVLDMHRSLTHSVLCSTRWATLACISHAFLLHAVLASVQGIIITIITGSIITGCSSRFLVHIAAILPRCYTYSTPPGQSSVPTSDTKENLGWLRPSKSTAQGIIQSERSSKLQRALVHCHPRLAAAAPQRAAACCCSDKGM